MRSWLCVGWVVTRSVTRSVRCGYVIWWIKGFRLPLQMTRPQGVPVQQLLNIDWICKYEAGRGQLLPMHTW